MASSNPHSFKLFVCTAHSLSVIFSVPLSAKGIFTVFLLYTTTASYLKGFKHFFICDALVIAAAEVFYLVGLGISAAGRQAHHCTAVGAEGMGSSSSTSVVHPDPLKFLLFCNTAICGLESAVYLQHSLIIHISFLHCSKVSWPLLVACLRMDEVPEPCYNLECSGCSFLRLSALHSRGSSGAITTECVLWSPMGEMPVFEQLLARALQAGEDDRGCRGRGAPGQGEETTATGVPSAHWHRPASPRPAAAPLVRTSPCRAALQERVPLRPFAG